MIYVLVLLLSISITAFFIPKILLISVRKRLLDLPNNRKIHVIRASRLGGLTFFPSLFFTIFLLNMYHLLTNTGEAINDSWLILSLGAIFLMYIIGVVDDIKGMRANRKLFYQILTSITIVLSGTWINHLYGLFGIYDLPVWVGVPFTIGLVVFIINAFNLIDGIDGLSSGLSILVLIAYFVLFYLRSDMTAAILAIASVGILMGFFRYNFWGFRNHVVKIFMGDSGTLFIGTIISILTLKLLYHGGSANYQTNQYIVLIAFSVLLVPCFDVLRIMLRRYCNGKPLFCADKNHIHHKLLALGLSSTQTLYAILCFSVAITVINVLLSRVIYVEYIILLDVLIWITFNVLITNRIHKHIN